MEREWGAQWKEWAEAIATLETRQRDLRQRRIQLELERRDEMTQVSYHTTATTTTITSESYQFYFVLVAVCVIVYLSGKVIIHSHVCPLNM